MSSELLSLALRVTLRLTLSFSCPPLPPKRPANGPERFARSSIVTKWPRKVEREKAAHLAPLRAHLPSASGRRSAHFCAAAGAHLGPNRSGDCLPLSGARLRAWAPLNCTHSTAFFSSAHSNPLEPIRHEWKETNTKRARSVSAKYANTAPTCSPRTHFAPLPAARNALTDAATSGRLSGPQVAPGRLLGHLRATLWALSAVAIGLRLLLGLARPQSLVRARRAGRSAARFRLRPAIIGKQWRLSKSVASVCGRLGGPIGVEFESEDSSWPAGARATVRGAQDARSAPLERAA